MKLKNGTCMIVAAAALGIAGCVAPEDPYRTTYPGGASYPAGGSAQYPAYPNPEYARYGYVEAVEAVAPERRDNAAVGVGAIGGAIAGGLLGHQVGSGRGNTAATIGGAVVGGVVGHQVEQQVRGGQAATATEYRFRVRMDDGTYQTFNKQTHDNIRVGDRVRVERNNLFSM
jgi:outer membrane lipoprotein SlyB